MNSKHRRTLVAIFAKPTHSDVLWSDVEALLLALGATVTEAEGSRVKILLRGVRAVFHRPHPKREASKAQIDSVRDFLRTAGVLP